MQTRKPPIPLAFLLPILAAAFVAVLGGGLGVIFIVIYASSLHEWGVIVLGMLLVIGVPIVAALVSRETKRGE